MMLVHIHLHFCGLTGSAPREGPGWLDGGVSLLSTAAPLGAAIAGNFRPCNAAAVCRVGSGGNCLPPCSRGRVAAPPGVVPFASPTFSAGCIESAATIAPDTTPWRAGIAVAGSALTVTNAWSTSEKSSPPVAPCWRSADAIRGSNPVIRGSHSPKPFRSKIGLHRPEACRWVILATASNPSGALTTQALHS